MPTVRLHARDPEVTEGVHTLGVGLPENGGPAYWPGSVLVGSGGDLLADDDDATYATVLGGVANGLPPEDLDVTVVQDGVVMALDTLTSGLTVTAAVLHYRYRFGYEGTGLSDTAAPSALHDVDDVDGFGGTTAGDWLFAWESPVSDTLGGEAEFDASWNLGSGSPVSDAATLLADPRIRLTMINPLGVTDTGKSILDLIEVWVDVTYEAGALFPVTRQYPRDDARGFGSAPRIYPPPRAGRIVGGYL